MNQRTRTAPGSITRQLHGHNGHITSDPCANETDAIRSLHTKATMWAPIKNPASHTHRHDTVVINDITTTIDDTGHWTATSTNITANYVPLPTPRATDAEAVDNEPAPVRRAAMPYTELITDPEGHAKKMARSSKHTKAVWESLLATRDHDLIGQHRATGVLIGRFPKDILVDLLINARSEPWRTRMANIIRYGNTVGSNRRRTTEEGLDVLNQLDNTEQHRAGHAAQPARR